MKNKTAQHNAGSRDFFSFCGAPTYRSRLCKNEMMAPNARRRRKIFGILGGVLYKKHEPPGGSAPAAGGKFLGIWGALYTKITLLGCIQERVSGAKHPPNLKISASGGPNPQMFENNPPLVAKSGITRGGFSLTFGRISGFLAKIPQKIFAASRRKRPHINGFRPFLAPLGAPGKFCTISYPLPSFFLHLKSDLYRENDKLFLQKEV